LPSALALRILIRSLAPFGFNQIFGTALIAGHKQNILLHANLVAMFGNIGLDLLLIPQYGFVGAAVANIASAFIVLIYQARCVSRYLFKANCINYIRKPFISSVIMRGVLLLLKERSLLISVPVSVLIYFIGLLALKTFSCRDRDLIRKLLRREKDLVWNRSD